MTRLAAPLMTAAVLLSGCVAEGSFPSLAQRPAELEDFSTDPVRPDPVIADDPALAGRIAALTAEAHAGWGEFEAEAGPAERAARASGAAGSDSWLVAQQAISRLEAARARTMIARAELDRLALERQDMPTSAADLRAIESAISESEEIAARQQSRLDRIRRD